MARNIEGVTHEQAVLDAIGYNSDSDARLWIRLQQEREALSRMLTDSSMLLSEFKVRVAVAVLHIRRKSGSCLHLAVT